MDHVDIFLIFLTILSILIVTFHLKTQQKLYIAIEHKENEIIPGESRKNTSTLISKLPEIVHFQRFIQFSSQIIVNSKRYATKINEFDLLLQKFPYNNTSSSFIDSEKLQSFLLYDRFKIYGLNLSYRIPVSYKDANDYRLFYLKTHKTGSSTLNNIIWRSFCLEGFDGLSNGTKRNCFVPQKENPGKTWGIRDAGTLMIAKGSSRRNYPFDIWNSHIRMNFLHFYGDEFQVTARNASRNTDGLNYNRTESSLAKMELLNEESFAKFVLSELVPSPHLLISMIRRPSTRFESAFHWYELAEIFESVQSQYENKYLEQQQASLSLRHQFHHHPNHRKKNRFNLLKFRRNNSSELSPELSVTEQAIKLQEFIEDIAFEFLEKLTTKISHYCKEHVQSPTFTRENCYLLYFTEFQSESAVFSSICKETIDELLLAFESIFHHRSGFQTLSKELTGINQFDDSFQQNRFEQSFDQLLNLWLSGTQQMMMDTALGRRSVNMSSSPLVYLLNIDDLSTSLLIFRSLLHYPSRLPYYYLPQKQQEYLRLSQLFDETSLAIVYYQFLDLFQYYDTLLYKTQESIQGILQEVSNISDSMVEEFSMELGWLKKECQAKYFRPRDLKRTNREEVVMALKLLDLIAIKEKATPLSPIQLFMQLTSREMQSICYLYSLDNHNFVELMSE